MSFKKEKLIFEKSISRDWCLMNAELHQESFTKSFKDQFEWSFTEVIYEGKNNIVSVYNPISEYFDGMRDFVISKIKRNNKWMEEQAHIITADVNMLDRYFMSILKNKLFSLDNYELCTVFNTYIEWNYRIWPRFLIIVMFPIQMENYSKFSNYSDAIHTAIKARKLIEKAGPILEDLGTDISKIISKRMKINPEYARYLSYKEILDYFSKGILPNENVLSSRKSYYVVTNQGISLDSVKNYVNKNNYILSNPEIADDKEINGKAAFPGKVRGKVRLILNKTMFKSFKKGEILVASMTTTDYLQIMKMSKAFITDEGGVTCHAAIVAREMKKPCIIGTKIATKLLKNGDLVEVDADNGIVTKLN